ncbi:hypothetical protein VTI74DRAFT_7182 [Chaetomium olivicolor]
MQKSWEGIKASDCGSTSGARRIWWGAPRRRKNKFGPTLCRITPIILGKPNVRSGNRISPSARKYRGPFSASSPPSSGGSRIREVLIRNPLLVIAYSGLSSDFMLPAPSVDGKPRVCLPECILKSRGDDASSGPPRVITSASGFVTIAESSSGEHAKIVRSLL